MQKAYSRINWENYPSTETPLNETNLNKIDEGLNTVDNRVVEFDLTKANQTDLLTCVDGITFNTSSGILIISFKNGTTATIDTGLAKLAVNFDYDDDPTSPHYQQLILEMKDGTYKYIDLSSMITQFEFDNTSTVVFNVDAQTGHISAVVPDGSITAQKLNPNVVVTMQAIEDAAEADALKSEGHAVGKQNGQDVGPDSPYYHNNAKYYCEQAQGGGSGGHVIKDSTTTYTQRNGLKFLGKASVSDDANGDNTIVTIEAGGAVPHLIVISETGSTVTATKGTTVIHATETSSEHFECDLEMDDPQDIYGTWVIDAILAGDDAQVSLNVDTIKVYTVDDSHFHADITVTYPNGATVSCSKTGEQTMYATSSPYTFVVHSAGVWTITGSRNGITETQTVTISTTGQEESITLTILPDGSTITPTDDVQILLYCADIWDKSYTAISELIADDVSLLKVLTSDNAIDYLVRSTTFASAITADSDAMAMIGSYDYASDTLLTDSTWATAIGGSAYFESVENAKVPIMTSNTTPSGECYSTTPYSGYYSYYAFNGGSTGFYCNVTSGNTMYVAYRFPKAIKVCRVDFKGARVTASNGWKYSIGTNNDDYTDVYTGNGNADTTSTLHSYSVKLASSTAKDTHKITITANANYPWFAEVQFYGRQNGGVQTWLRSGGITDKPYTTLAEVLADTTTLSALIANHDAVDYLVTAKGLIDGIVADATAMSYIGLNNYCANTLLTDADWKSGICNSTYWNSVLNAHIPTMTDYTVPSGEAFANMDYSGKPWHAFDKNTATSWASYGNSYAWPNYVGYDFGEGKSLKALVATYQAESASRLYTFQIQGSNDNITWDILYNGTNTDGQSHKLILTNPGEYRYFRIYGIAPPASGAYWMSIYEFDVFGREDV